MLVIFGFGHQTRKENELRDHELCRHCGNSARMILRSKTNWFSLFFIPVIPYSSRYGKVCPVCNRGPALNHAEYMDLMNKTL